MGYSITQTANIGNVKTQAVITRMDFPLGEWTGNACEIYEIMAALGPNNPDYSPIWEKI